MERQVVVTECLGSWNAGKAHLLMALMSGLEKQTPGLPSGVLTGGFLTAWWPQGSRASHRVGHSTKHMFQHTRWNCIIFPDLTLPIRQRHFWHLLMLSESQAQLQRSGDTDPPFNEIIDRKVVTISRKLAHYASSQIGHLNAFLSTYTFIAWSLTEEFDPLLVVFVV